MSSKTKILPFILILSFFFLFPACYSQNDTLRQSQPLRDWETRSSANGLFRMQFFSLGNSPNRYLGIFYNMPSNPDWMLSSNDEKAVWVANRNTPIPDASGNLGIDSDGRLKISYNSGGSNAILLNSVPSTGNLTATLLNNGNFVLRELNSNGSVHRVLWESFDYPTDTLLPGMKLGINFRTGHVWSLTSWISDVLPASGSFTFGGDPNNTTQLIIWWRGNISWMSGPWRNGRFENAQRLSIEPGHEFTYVSNADEKYFMYSTNQNRTYNIPPRYTMAPDGYVTQARMMAPFGQCFRTNISAPIPPGCEEHGWPECRRRNYWFFILRQGRFAGAGFRYSDSSNMSLFDCETACRNNCSCIAYAATSYNKTGCALYGKGMIFQNSLSSLDEAYILKEDKEAWFKVWMIWLAIGLAPLVLILLCSSCCIMRRRVKLKGEKKAKERLLIELERNTTSTPYSSTSYYTKDEKMSDELHSFSFEIIAAATNNFHSRDKLGEGGFGPVYKGVLLNGQEVAIKRLSRSSGQGLEEFKNEILLIAKLQHTNLVRLLGCCIQGQEKILVYEYMPNKSLDFFLFNPGKKELLKWTTRFNIIEGIAQGLLYLHKYSRLRIIHRDLKASNILLDDNFNPKISDFGMARIFGMNESEANTNRVVGTYGYMSPEYAMNGIFSMKSDVYSFGVLLLEIVSSRRNNSSYQSDRQLNLIGLAWELWKEARAAELIDSAVDDDCSREQVLRCIHVSLLCAQDNAIDRPSMSDVISMLTSETMSLPAPKQPAFFIDTGSSLADDASGTHSVNKLTISMMQAR